MKREKLGVILAFAALITALFLALITAQPILLSVTWSLMWALWIFGLVLHRNRVIFVTAMIGAALLMILVILTASLTTPCYYWFCGG